MRGVYALVAVVFVALAGSAASTAPLASHALRCAGVGVVLLGPLLMFWRLFRREAALGRGAPLSPSTEIDAAWLAQHLFSIAPELVGAVYKRRVATPEVAAVMARMSVESKLASRVAPGARGWNNLELWLLVERDELAACERELVDCLFQSRKSTSADAVREAYAATGFDPARLLRRHLQGPADVLLGIRPARAWPLWLALAASGAGILLAVRPWTWSALPLVAAVVLSSLGPLWSALACAAAWSRNLQRRAAQAWPFVGFVALGSLSLALLIALWPQLSPLGVLSLGAWGLTIAALVARVAASRESEDGFALRQRLGAAREFFAGELARPEPQIADDWLPYLIALELRAEVEHWFVAFGRLETAALNARQANRSPAHAGATEAAPRAWTGGGGALGGSGASAAWITATEGLTVAPPAARSRRTGAGSTRGAAQPAPAYS